jgi:hypothetical protein
MWRRNDLPGLRQEAGPIVDKTGKQTNLVGKKADQLSDR